MCIHHDGATLGQFNPAFGEAEAFGVRRAAGSDQVFFGLQHGSAAIAAYVERDARACLADAAIGSVRDNVHAFADKINFQRSADFGLGFLAVAWSEKPTSPRPIVSWLSVAGKDGSTTRLLA